MCSLSFTWLKGRVWIQRAIISSPKFTRTKSLLAQGLLCTVALKRFFLSNLHKQTDIAIFFKLAVFLSPNGLGGAHHLHPQKARWGKHSTTCALVSKSTLPKAWIKFFIKSEGHYDSWQCSSIFQCLKFKAKTFISSEKKVGLTWTQIFAVQHLQPVLPKWADVSKVNINIQYKLNLEISFCLTCWHWWLLLLLFWDYGSYAKHFSAY